MELAYGRVGECDAGGRGEGAQDDDDCGEEYEGVAWGGRGGGREWEQGDGEHELRARCVLREEEGAGQGGEDGELGSGRDLEEAQAGDEWELDAYTGESTPVEEWEQRTNRDSPVES